MLKVKVLLNSALLIVTENLFFYFVEIKNTA